MPNLSNIIESAKSYINPGANLVRNIFISFIDIAPYAFTIKTLKEEEFDFTTLQDKLFYALQASYTVLKTGFEYYKSKCGHPSQYPLPVKIIDALLSAFSAGGIAAVGGLLINLKDQYNDDEHIAALKLALIILISVGSAVGFFASSLFAPQSKSPLGNNSTAVLATISAPGNLNLPHYQAINSNDLGERDSLLENDFTKIDKDNENSIPSQQNAKNSIN